MVVNVLFVAALFTYSCNGDDIRGDLASSSLLNIGGYAANGVLSPGNTLSQPSVASSRGLESLTKLIANGGGGASGNYIIDASAFGRGLLLAKNGNIADPIGSLTNNEKNNGGETQQAISELLQDIYEKSKQNNLEAFGKTVLNPVQEPDLFKKQYINVPAQINSQDAVQNLRVVATPNQFSFVPNVPTYQPSFQPLGVTKLNPVPALQKNPVSFVRTLYIVLPNIFPPVVPKPRFVRTSNSNKQASSRPVLRILKTVPVGDDDDFD